ncbi:MAG: superoxide dismutase [Nitrospinae bacterium]|nr:superoxide dismutase [Nitrospinota bacterium]
MGTITKTTVKYEAKSFLGLAGLKGITPFQIEEHLKLYNGYVKNVNLLRDKISKLLEKGDEDVTEISELSRRVGFEINGMRLHELYFENLSGTALPTGDALKSVVEESFGTWEKWEAEFRVLAAMRGVGWVILYQDPETGHLTNHWIGLHEEGHPVGFTPLLVCDVWEHAWTGYLKPTERKKYIDDFFRNVNWLAVEKRIP